MKERWEAFWIGAILFGFFGLFFGAILQEGLEYNHKLGQSICEERELGDYVSFDGETLNLHQIKPIEQQYDGIKIRVENPQ